MKIAIVAALLTLAPVTVLAQAVSPATSGTMTSADVGVSPISGQSGPNYVLAAADANFYQIKAAQLAATRAQRDDVKAYAKRVLAETQSSHKALLAALKNDQRTIKAPPSNLSADRAATVTVNCPGINAYADGEYVCPLPVEISAVRSALKLLVGATGERATPRRGSAR